MKTAFSLIVFFALSRVYAGANLADFDGKTYYRGSSSQTCAFHLEVGYGNTLHATNVVAKEQRNRFESDNGHTKVCGSGGTYGHCRKQTFVLTCDLETGACATFDKPSLWLLPDGNITFDYYQYGVVKLQPSLWTEYSYCD